jgi:predicted nucleotide-binding protein
MTAEDERADGKLNARLNVVHEIGLFQGRRGFNRAIILLEEGCEEFSNVHASVTSHSLAYQRLLRAYKVRPAP